MVFAPAKINLFLHVTGRAENGYHYLQSLMAPLAFGDRLEATPATAFTLEIKGDASLASLPPEQNLVLKAALLLNQKTAHLTLHKQIPHAAGLGGGSSDAAATLMLLNETLSPAELAQLALQLGADVPFFLQQSACYVEGIGEVLTPVKLPQYPILLVKPAEGVSTQAVFRMGFSSFSAPLKKAPDCTLETLRSLRNDLTPNALKLCPEIGAILARIEAQPGCLLARMSGSGSTCFGIFESAELCKQAEAAFPEYWTKATHPL